jgi:hypothetical protein
MWIEMETNKGMQVMINMARADVVWKGGEDEIWIDDKRFTCSTKESRDARYEEIKRILGDM